MTPDEKIKVFKQKGYSNEQMSTYFRAEFKKRNYKPEQIERWLAAKHIRPETISKYSFFDEVSTKMRGFGRDVFSGLGAGLMLAKKGTGPVGQLLSLPAAYAMGSAGQNVEDALRKEQPQTWGEAIPRYHKAGMKGLQDELAGGPLAQMFGKAAAPFAKKMSLEQFDIARTIEREGLPISPDQYSPSKVTSKVLQKFADWFPTGRIWGHVKRNQLQKNLVRMKQELLNQLPYRASRGEAGAALKGGVQTIKKQATERAAAAYKVGAKEAGGEQARFPMNQTKEFVDKTMDTVTHPQFKRLMEDISQSTREGTASYKDVDSWLAEMWSGKKDRTWPIRGKLKETILSDLKVWDEQTGSRIFQARQLADEAFKKKLSLNKNPTIRTIASERNLDRVILNAIKDGNIDDINFILKELAPVDRDIVRSRFVENLLEASSSYDGIEKVFNPGKFADLVDKYSVQIKNTMPELHKNMVDFGRVSKASIADFKKQQLGSELMGGAALPLMMGGKAAITGSVSIPGIAVPAGFSFITAKSLMNPKGWMRKWLTTGLKPEGTKQMLRLGGRFGDAEKTLGDIKSMFGLDEDND